jgi:mannosyltransferase
MQPSEAAANQNTEAAPVPSDFLPWAHRLTLLLLTAAGTAIRLLYLARKPFWFDECFSAEVARIDWSSFAHLMWWREANMSLYYLLLRIWLGFESPHAQSEFFIRSLSVIFSAATLPAIYWLAGLLYDRRVALIATALLFFNAYHVRYAQEARSYSLFVLLATLSSGFLIAFLRQPSRRLRTAYIVVSILAVYAHFYALLLVVAHWIVLRWLPPPQSANQSDVTFRAQMRHVWITIGIAVMPLLIFVAKTGAGPIKWIPRPGVRDLLVFYEHLAGGNSWPLPVIFAAACVAAIPYRKSLGQSASEFDKAHPQTWKHWRVQFLLIWLLSPVIVTVLLSFIRPVFLPRYLIFCLPPLLILAAGGLARLRRWWLLAPALAIVLLLGSQAIFFVYAHDFDTERDASGTATNFILDQAHPRDAILFHIADTRVAYEFFRSLRAGENTASPAFTAPLGPEIVFPHHGAGLDYRDFTGKPAADLLHTAATNHPRLWVMLMNNGPADNPDPTTVMLTRALVDSFPTVQQWQLPHVEVRLYGPLIEK